MVGIFSRATDIYQEMWKAIIRPPRDQYTIDQLGPEDFFYRQRRYKRRDFQLTNRRGLQIQCSHFEPVSRNGEYDATPQPCVVYLHGNCSSRLEAVHCGCLRVLLPLGISVVCFDFSGSGLSEGEYVSLGWYESEDLKEVIQHLRQLGRVSTIGLWGRSMGAVTACMFVDQDPSIAGIVVDSPFASLRRLAEELAGDFFGWKIPKLFLNPALNMVRSTIQTKANFDLDDLEPIQHCGSSFTPAFFIAAKEDSFIRPHHAKSLHDAYAGDKNFILVEGNHNTARPDFLHDSVSFFFRYFLQYNVNLGVQSLAASFLNSQCSGALSSSSADSKGCASLAETDIEGSDFTCEMQGRSRLHQPFRHTMPVGPRSNSRRYKTQPSSCCPSARRQMSNSAHSNERDIATLRHQSMKPRVTAKDSPCIPVHADETELKVHTSDLFFEAPLEKEEQAMEQFIILESLHTARGEPRSYTLATPEGRLRSVSPGGAVPDAALETLLEEFALDTSRKSEEPSSPRSAVASASNPSPSGVSCSAHGSSLPGESDATFSQNVPIVTDWETLCLISSAPTPDTARSSLRTQDAHKASGAPGSSNNAGNGGRSSPRRARKSDGWLGRYLRMRPPDAAGPSC